MDEVPVDAVIRDVVDSFEKTAREKGINLRIDDLPAWEVSGHDVWLGQLFSNLLENAMKFTPEGGSIVVAGTANGSSAKFSVEDTGIGIPEKHVPYVFDRFYRVDSSREHYCGTGLGLAICKSIADVHRGTITVEARPGGGTRFVVSLPSVDPIQQDGIPSA